MTALKIKIPTIDKLHNEVQRVFGLTPCPFQTSDAIAQLQRQDCMVYWIGSCESIAASFGSKKYFINAEPLNSCKIRVYKQTQEAARMFHAIGMRNSCVKAVANTTKFTNVASLQGMLIVGQVLQKPRIK